MRRPRSRDRRTERPVTKSGCVAGPLQRSYRTCGDGSIHELNLTELKSLDAGSWFDAEFAGQQVPTLEELFGCCGERVHYLLEIKDPGLVEEQLVEAIVASGLDDRIYVIGMNAESLEKVKAIRAEVGVGFTCRFSTMRAYLECGILAYGFVRARCEDCGASRAVAFSC